MNRLSGLLLTGGQSRRMGRDKALLQRNGVSLLDRGMGLLEKLCEKQFVSVSVVTEHGQRSQYPQIPDQFGGQGPVDGIASAQLKDPQAAWLVLACDLPLLDLYTLQWLVDHRSSKHEVTAFVSTNSQLPEPLCAIYEPSSAPKIQQLLTEGVRSARKMVMDLDHNLLHQPSEGRLVNANTPQQWQSIDQ